jgi:hypothetical protein
MMTSTGAETAHSPKESHTVAVNLIVLLLPLLAPSKSTTGRTVTSVLELERALIGVEARGGTTTGREKEKEKVKGKSVLSSVQDLQESLKAVTSAVPLSGCTSKAPPAGGLLTEKVTYDVPWARSRHDPRKRSEYLTPVVNIPGLITRLGAVNAVVRTDALDKSN